MSSLLKTKNIHEYEVIGFFFINTAWLIDLTDYSLFTQWPRFRVKHLLEFVGSGAKLQLCY